MKYILTRRLCTEMLVICDKERRSIAYQKSNLRPGSLGRFTLERHLQRIRQRLESLLFLPGVGEFTSETWKLKGVQLSSDFAKRRTNDREAGIIFCFSCPIRAHYPFESRFHSGIRCEFLRVETRLGVSLTQSLTNSLKISLKWKQAFTLKKWAHFFKMV